MAKITKKIITELYHAGKYRDVVLSLNPDFETEKRLIKDTSYMYLWSMLFILQNPKIHGQIDAKFIKLEIDRLEPNNKTMLDAYHKFKKNGFDSDLANKIWKE